MADENTASPALNGSCGDADDALCPGRTNALLPEEAQLSIASKRITTPTVGVAASH